MQRFKSDVEQKSVLWARYRAEVAHQLNHHFRDISHLSKSRGVGKAVVRGIGRAQSCEFFGVRFPVEVAAIHHNAANRGGMSVHIFRCRVGNDVASPLKGVAIDGRGKGVVHNQGHAIAVGNACELLNI